MPVFGLGTRRSKPGMIYAAVKEALSLGYRHFDCATVYGNELEVGAAFKETLADDEGKSQEERIRRGDVFVTGKLWNTFHKPEHVEPQLRKSLSDLNLTYIDLYLIHWPVAFEHSGDELYPKTESGDLRCSSDDFVETWKAMEALVEKGLVRAIGLSNFNRSQITRILESCTIRPSVLQVECHPYLDQSDMIDFATKEGVVVTGFSPLGYPGAADPRPKLIDDSTVRDIARRVGKSPAQVLIRYQIQRNVVVIPKSVTASRLAENIDVFDFVLDDAEMGALTSLGCGRRVCHGSSFMGSKFFPFEDVEPAVGMPDTPTGTARHTSPRDSHTPTTALSASPPTLEADPLKTC